MKDQKTDWKLQFKKRIEQGPISKQNEKIEPNEKLYIKEMIKPNERH